MKIPQSYIDLLELNIGEDILLSNEIKVELEQKMDSLLFNLGVEHFSKQLVSLFKKELPSQFSLLQNIKKNPIKVDKEGLFLFYNNPNLLLFPFTGVAAIDASNLIVNTEFIKKNLIDLARKYQMHLATKESYLDDVFEEVLKEDFPHLTDDIKFLSTVHSIKPRLVIPNSEDNRFSSSSIYRGVDELRLPIDILMANYKKSIYEDRTSIAMHLFDPKNKESLKLKFQELIDFTYRNFEWSLRGQVIEIVLKSLTDFKKRRFPSERIEVFISKIGSKTKIRMDQDQLHITFPLNVAISEVERVKKFIDMLFSLDPIEFRYLSRFKITCDSTEGENFSFELGFCSVDLKFKELAVLIKTAKLHEQKYYEFINSGNSDLTFDLPSFSPFYLNKKESKDGSLVKIRCKDSFRKKGFYLFFVNGESVSNQAFYKAQRRFYNSQKNRELFK